MKLFIDPAAMKMQYEASPEWLRTMNAFADGLNYYLASTQSEAESDQTIRALMASTFWRKVSAVTSSG